MDLKQVEYIVRIADEGSITRAAEKLFITQSALNQQLLKLEKELGLPLFNRAKNAFTLTHAGEIYIENARELLRIKEETYRVLNDMARHQCGNLSVGLTPERGIQVFLSIYPEFYEKYPGISINPLEIGVKQQLSMISDGQLDLGFVTVFDYQRTGGEYLPLQEEDILLAVPASNKYAALPQPSGDTEPTINLSLFRDEPFLLMPPSSTIRDEANRLFQSAGFQPNILFETASNRTIWSMVSRGLGCAFLPRFYARPSDGISYFQLPQRPRWAFCATYRRGCYISQPAQDFIQMAKTYVTAHPTLSSASAGTLW